MLKVAIPPVELAEKAALPPLLMLKVAVWALEASVKAAVPRLLMLKVAAPAPELPKNCMLVLPLPPWERPMLMVGVGEVPTMPSPKTIRTELPVVRLRV
jgi:hypothetical protein